MNSCVSADCLRNIFQATLTKYFEGVKIWCCLTDKFNKISVYLQTVHSADECAVNVL